MDVSPDGERILAKEFYDTQYPDFGNSVILLNSRFKDQTMIIDNSNKYWDFAHAQGSFSPDGKTIAAVCAGSLYLYHPDNPGSPVLADIGVIGKPEFSPDNHALAYLVNGWPAALRILDFTSHHKRDIYDSVGGSHLAWSPDNRAIAFFNWKDSDFVEVAEIEVETSHLTPVISNDSIFTPTPDFFNNPLNYSPDGKVLVFSMRRQYWYPRLYYNSFSLVYNRATKQIDTLKGFTMHQYLPTGFHALGTAGTCPVIYNFVTRHIDTLYGLCQKINNDYVWAITIDKIFFRPSSIGNFIVIDTYDYKENKQSLVHAYPNPFNPSTKIHYSVNKGDAGFLKIHTITGKLVLSRPVIGNGIFEWNARGLSSGTYILQIKTGRKQYSRKLILEK
jgi:Tol biopolymer transport system component